MKPTVITALAMLAALPNPANAAIRAVFVGVDKYLYSKARLPDAQFRDLSGAVGDAGRIKAALRQAYRLDLDREVAGKCRSANSVSITLTDYCATKAAVFGAWDAQIDASQPGDTLILYFAGHGSRFTEDQINDQASLHNSTMMPTDARRPGAEAATDILDREIREVINRATGKGVRVVTLFDSCNSGTVTRDGDGENRTAPEIRVQGVRPVPEASNYGIYGAYRVHLAAAADGEEAKEVGGVGARAGVFTTALASTLVEMPGASFADIAATVRLKVTKAGNTRQNPHAEGALRATLGGEEVRVPLFDAVKSGAGVIIAGGRLTGVTQGSAFALYPSTSAALPGDTGPLATGRVAQVDASQAVLTLDAPMPPDLPGRLIARETAHNFTGQVLSVRIDLPAPADRASVTATLAKVRFVRVADQGQVSVSQRGSTIRLLASNGAQIAELPALQSPSFSAMFYTALLKVARVNALLAGQSDPATSGIEFCIRNPSEDFDAATCPPLESAEGRLLQINQPALISVVNRNEESRFIYVLGIDQEYSVTLLLPPYGALDPAIEAGQPLRIPEGQDIAPSDPGLYRFLTIATDAPINATVLEQTSAGTRDQTACLTALARQLCSDSSGKRDPSMPRVGKWSAAVSNAVVR
jgi:hypothetical protein